MRARVQPRTWRGIGATTLGPSVASTPQSETANRQAAVGSRMDDANHGDDPFWDAPQREPPPMTAVELPATPLASQELGGRKHVDYRLDPAPV